MTINPININSLSKRLAFSCSFLLCVFNLHAQTEVTAPMTGTPVAGEYYSKSAITLSPGFNFVASAGQGFHAYILDGDCIPLNNLIFSQNQNYISTSIPRIPMDSFSIAGRSSCDVMQTVQYIDGLGRPLQTVQVKGSPKGQDIVQPSAYDAFGREAVKYLPYAATTADGSYKPGALTEVNSFYNPTGNGLSGAQQSNGVVVNPYPSASTTFEPSPLNRPVEQGAPGLPWQLSASGVAGGGHTTRIAYGTNSGTDASLWSINATGNGLTGGNTNYGAGQLYTTTVTDENGNNTIEYKDNEGRVICKKIQSGPTTYLVTNYVYNDLGNLVYVLPPLPSGTTYSSNFLETSSVFLNFVYGYHYDERNRLVEKKVPGKGWEYMVYNNLDHLVITQDANQRLSPLPWNYTQYDILGRVVITGLWASAGPASRQSMVNWVNNQTTLWLNRDNTTTTGYSAVDPQGTTLTINYYDDYTFPGKPYTSRISGAMVNPTGLLTATKTAVLNADGTYGPMLWTVYYYDDKGRNLQTFKQHYLGGIASVYNYDQINNTYNDITSELTSSNRKHYTKNANNTDSIKVVTVSNSYVYDHMGRRIQTKEQIDNNPEILLSMTDYNEIGQVMTKHLHGANATGSFLQDIDYAYNERGWLLKINDPAAALSPKRLFAEQLNYNLPVNGATAQFNGNIAEQIYNAGVSGNRNVKYSYDALNRLTSGISSTGFSESNISYDELGNIKSLTRATNTPYTYSYIGNQLQTVTGLTGSTYTYDQNGNMTHDGRNNNNIAYNLLDLPRSVSGSATIAYIYNASGEKLRKISGNVATDYIAGIQYTTTGTGTPVIDFIQTEEGRANKSGTNYIYEYTLMDHLGNNRVTFDQANGKVGEDDYYPFGMNVHRQQTGVGNKYLYNKKELQEELNQYDYGARFYDPVIARWTSVDPLAEISRRWSPYNYVMNNPIRNIDPDGMAATGPNGGEYYVGAAAENYMRGVQAAGIALSQIPGGGGPGDKNKKKQESKPKDDKNKKKTSTDSESKEGKEAGAIIVGAIKKYGPTIAAEAEEGGADEGWVSPVFITAFIASLEVNYELIKNHFKFANRKGERGQAGSASGTDNPYKKLKPDPNKPGNVLEKDSNTGKTVSKKAPPGFQEWWDSKH